MAKMSCLSDKNRILRLLRECEMEMAIKLWDACFENTPGFTRWFFETRVSPERVIGLFEGGELVSNTLMYPYRLRLRGSEVIAPYILGAATLPEHRRKGHMERVLSAAMEHMRELGVGVTFLHPFRYGFYQKLGWERATSIMNYSLSAERVRKLCEGGDFVSVKNGDGPKLLPLYEALCGGCDPGLIRGETECEYRIGEMLLEGGFGLLGSDAYALCYQKGAELKVFELAYSRGDAVYPLLGTLARREGVDTLTFGLPVWEAQPVRFMDEPPPGLSPYMMMRVVDVRKALTGLKFDGITDGMTLSVTDSMCKWNEGAYYVGINAGKSEAARVKSADTDASMDIGVLSMLLSGYMSYDDALKWGLVDQKRNNPQLSHAFTYTRGFILEQY